MAKPGLLLQVIRDDKREFCISGYSHSSDHIKTSKLSRKLRQHFSQCIVNTGICSTKAKTPTETRDMEGERGHSFGVSDRQHFSLFQ